MKKILSLLLVSSFISAMEPMWDMTAYEPSSSTKIKYIKEKKIDECSVFIPHQLMVKGARQRFPEVAFEKRNILLVFLKMVLLHLISQTMENTLLKLMDTLLVVVLFLELSCTQ